MIRIFMWCIAAWQWLERNHYRLDPYIVRPTYSKERERSE